MSRVSPASLVWIALLALSSPARILAQPNFSGTATAVLLSLSEVPSVFGFGSGKFDATVNSAGSSIAWELQYDRLIGNVTQAHIHFAEEHANGGIVVFFCSNLDNAPAGTPACPAAPGHISGTFDATDIVAGAQAQGIAPPQFKALLWAMRKGATYANVHSDRFPGGEIRGQLHFTPSADRPVAEPSTWGVGTDGRVYRWDGSSWAEPNPVARLKQVSVGKHGGGVLGVGQDGRVYKWNGNSWTEINPMARLDHVANMNGTNLWGIGSAFRIFYSENGGASWDEILSSVHLKQISGGNWDNILGLTEDSHILRFDRSTGGWEEPSPNARLYQIDAWSVEGAWGIGNESNLRIYKTYDMVSWIEPNLEAGLYQVSGIDDLNAWGVGASGRVFMTTNGGASWIEPNPAARLKQVSMGFE